MRIVALDIGDRYIGVAVTDPLGIVSRPFKTLANTSLAKLMKELKTLSLIHI